MENEARCIWKPCIDWFYQQFPKRYTKGLFFLCLLLATKRLFRTIQQCLYQSQPDKEIFLGPFAIFWLVVYFLAQIVLLVLLKIAYNCLIDTNSTVVSSFPVSDDTDQEKILSRDGLDLMHMYFGSSIAYITVSEYGISAVRFVQDILHNKAISSLQTSESELEEIFHRSSVSLLLIGAPLAYSVVFLTTLQTIQSKLVAKSLEYSIVEGKDTENPSKICSFPKTQKFYRNYFLYLFVLFPLAICYELFTAIEMVVMTKDLQSRIWAVPMKLSIEMLVVSFLWICFYYVPKRLKNSISSKARVLCFKVDLDACGENVVLSL